MIMPFHAKSWNLHPAVLALLISTVIPRGGRAQEISIQNEANAPVNITAAEIVCMPHQKLTVDDHGKSVMMGGVPLRQVLEKAGVTFDHSMHGKSLTRCPEVCSICRPFGDWLYLFLVVDASSPEWAS